jgi:hypothetical protein
MRKKSWQTIAKKIRVAVSRVVNRLRAGKMIKKVAVRMLAADKASRADSKVVSRVANKVELKRAVSKAAANSIGETK